MAYRNNLTKGDRVVHAETKRPGTVDANPRESSVTVGVCWQGTTVAQYVHISKLRLVLDAKGTVDEHPPCDGEPPDRPARSAPETPRPGALDPTDPAGILRAKHQRNLAQMAELNKVFSSLKAENERIEVALRALTPP